MFRLGCIAAVCASVAFGQSDYYSRPNPIEPYTSVWTRPAPAPQPNPAPSSAEGVPTQVAPTPAPATPVAPTLPPLPLTTKSVYPAMLLEAELVTGVMATPLAETPVLARIPKGGNWCDESPCPELYLIGYASFSPNGRAVVSFDLAYARGTPYQIRGTAFDPGDKFFGLTGTVTDIAPALAADLIRGAVGGLVDWVQALNRQSNTTLLPGGGLSTSTQAAPFWAYSLGRIGGIFALPQNSTSIVRALVKGAGERILILTFPPNQAQNTPTAPGGTGISLPLNPELGTPLIPVIPIPKTP